MEVSSTSWEAQKMSEGIEFVLCSKLEASLPEDVKANSK